MLLGVNLKIARRCALRISAARARVWRAAVAGRIPDPQIPIWSPLPVFPDLVGNGDGKPRFPIQPNRETEKSPFPDSESAGNGKRGPGGGGPGIWGLENPTKGR